MLLKLPGARSAGRGRGFTLVELLVVLAIIGIVAAMSLPVLTSLNGAYNLDAAGQGVVSLLNLARQTALASSHPVRVCFFQIADYNGSSPNVYRAVQCFQEGVGTSPTLTPITKPYFFAPRVKVFTGQAGGADASSLVDTTFSGVIASSNSTYNPGNATITLPAPYGPSFYTFFRFRSDGQIDLSTSGTTAWTTGSLTLVLESAQIGSTGLPANFITLQINSVVGTIRVFRP